MRIVIEVDLSKLDKKGLEALKTLIEVLSRASKPSVPKELGSG